MAAYRQVYDSRHLQVDCQEPDQLRDPTLVIEYGLPFSIFLPLPFFTFFSRDGHIVSPTSGRYIPVCPSMLLLFLCFWEILVLLSLTAYNSTMVPRTSRQLLENINGKSYLDWHVDWYHNNHWRFASTTESSQARFRYLRTSVLGDAAITCIRVLFLFSFAMTRVSPARRYGSVSVFVCVRLSLVGVLSKRREGLI